MLTANLLTSQPSLLQVSMIVIVASFSMVLPSTIAIAAHFFRALAHTIVTVASFFKMLTPMTATAASFSMGHWARQNPCFQPLGSDRTCLPPYRWMGIGGPISILRDRWESRR